MQIYADVCSGSALSSYEVGSTLLLRQHFVVASVWNVKKCFNWIFLPLDFISILYSRTYWNSALVSRWWCLPVCFTFRSFINYCLWAVVSEVSHCKYLTASVTFTACGLQPCRDLGWIQRPSRGARKIHFLQRMSSHVVESSYSSFHSVKPRCS